MDRFASVTIGCKVNQYETEAVAALLVRLGLRRTGLADSGPEPCDLVVINTCCVTSSAAAKTRQAIRRTVRRHPAAHVLILGCYATQSGNALRRVVLDAGSTGRVHVAGHCDDVAAFVRRLVGTSGGGQPAAGVGSLPAGTAPPSAECAAAPSGTSGETYPGDLGRANIASSPAGPVGKEGWMRAKPSQLTAGLNPSTVSTSASIQPSPSGAVKQNVGTSALPCITAFADHQRAFVKVQDGCDAFCTYCVVPHLRHRLWWRPAEEVAGEVEALVDSGHREVVLCGVFLGAYGGETTVRRRWSGPSALPALLDRIARVPGLWRVRLSSLHPGDVTDELLAVFRHRPTVAPHLHLPLQSGSRRILRRMNRQYGPAEYLQAVERFRQAVRTPAVTTDVLVGSPDESDEDFAETLDLARTAGFAKIHVFPFSPRPGTAAWQWRRQVPPGEVVKARCRQLAAVERQTAAAFRRQFVGRRVEVLVERAGARTPPGRGRGRTDRYLEVTFPIPSPGASGGKGLTGQVVGVRISGVSETGLRGRLAGG